ncbi:MULTISPECIES: NAD(P)/FAD-dependent oxidoreductase [unclassified Mesorhizobium]|uniref:NAD(P)/FAD-dependent oxidoreductase n=1 Tax=unclassified Mesorhizobium TaxID=325217 RepID=UPI001CCC9974|nr:MULTISPECIES: FAD-binding oxidoreductase [unclassified Mesorhizobium]MBZ9739822.1 FAD-binding oxidoreductase [Mesorhizobium sp. CO1-1-4]MBZ9805633.1 FAD-binding oxidoreductase [Mesorhizobium sp. ES1-6]
MNVYMPELGKEVAIIGAGIVGVSAALYMKRAGLSVTVLDPLPPGTATSFGNAGMVRHDCNVPVAIPGMLRQVPGWLTDPLGPLVLRPRYALKAAPWLLRWIRAGRMDRVNRAADALCNLHRGNLECYRDLIGGPTFAALIREVGGIQIWESEARGLSDRITAEINERQGVVTESLSRSDLERLLPGISNIAKRGLLYPHNAHTIDPHSLVMAIADGVRQAGGVFEAERVLKIIPREAGGYTLMTNTANRKADAVIVAAGAWSNRLLEPLGAELPLETERGYHLMIPSPSIELPMPVQMKNRGFALSPMEHGLRLAGTVEIAGLEAPPDERRSEILLTHARALFPDLKGGEPTIWMGFRPSLPDSVPAIGQVRGHSSLFVATGHGHTGMIGGGSTGRLIAELVTASRPHIDPAPYSPDRF